MSINIPPVDEDPSDADVHFLEDHINQYNVETTKIGDGRIISFLLRNERADIIAGLYGWTWGGTCEIRYLWVREDFRKRGYGKALIEAAEREAIARGCNQIVLDTHSFQALLFYQRLGFGIIGSFADYPRRHYKHFPAEPRHASHRRNAIVPRAASDRQSIPFGRPPRGRDIERQ